jgi:hypothetical protein
MKAFKLAALLCLLTSPLFAADQTAGTNDATPAAPTHTKKVEKAPNFIWAKDDPMIGDWQGSGGIVAQVYLTPGGQYQANLLKAFDSPDNLIATLQGKASADGVAFSGGDWTGSIKGSHFTGTKGSDSFDLSHVVRQSPTLGVAAPAGAVVLFDGKNFDAWAKKAGKEWTTEDGPAKWKLVDGAMQIVPGADSLISHQKFGDCHVHVEFRTLGFPSKSAVFLEARYEVNINETYGKTTGNMTGGLDNSMDSPTPPKVRAALPPLVWQTFDIDFRAPKLDASGGETEKPRMTVALNGVKIYDQQELDSPHGAAGRLGEALTGPIMLQDHLTPLEYRNIWVLEGK